MNDRPNPIPTSSPTRALRRSAERGHVAAGWLDSRHTFSFGHYHDPAHMGFGDLRVINEDRVAPAAGFPPHGHRDMEIVSYVIDGALEHRDSTGSGGVLRHGHVQVMSAGHGIRHSEMNASATEPVHFLQIWLQPASRGGAPRHAERDFGLDRGLTLLASPDGRDASLAIGQDADLYRLLASPGDTRQLALRGGRSWVQLVAGELEVGGDQLRAGDGLALTGVQHLELRAHTEVEAVIFDLR